MYILLKQPRVGVGYAYANSMSFLMQKSGQRHEISFHLK